MHNKSPKITVVMPFYNREKFIEETIKSVLAQTFTDFEFIAIDDGSTDTSVKIVQEYAKRDTRIILIHNDINRGISYSRNRGNAMARADLIAVVDSDDIYMPERFAKQYAYMQKHPEITIVGTYAYVIDESGVRTGDEIAYLSDQEKISKTFFHLGPFLHSSVIYRKDDVQSIGGYREQYNMVEDMDLYYRLLFSGKIGTNVPEFLFEYRRHSQATGIYVQKKRDILFAIKRNLIKLYKPKLCIADYYSIYVSYALWSIFPENVMLRFEAIVKKIVY